VTAQNPQGGPQRLYTLIALGLAFLVVLGLPFVLRPEEPAEAADAGPDLEEKELNIISVHAETIRREFARAFSEWTAQTRGFTVNVIWEDVGGTLAAQRYVDDQFAQKPQGIDVDIFFGGGVDPFLHFMEKGVLHRCNIPQDVLKRVPQQYAGMDVYDPEQRWFGACLAGFGILTNDKVLEFLDISPPREWKALGQPRYFTWVSSADPRQSGSMHMVYEIILQAYGWEEGWETVMRIGANCRAFSGQASDVPREVSAGEAACGMAIDTYALRAVAEAGRDRMSFHLPEGLTVVNPDAIGVLKGAPHPELAELFVQFVLSERGQKLWILRAGAPGGPKEFELYRLPVIPGLIAKYRQDAVVTFDPFDFEGGVQFDSPKMSKRWRILNDLFGARIVDTHDGLARAWKRLRNLPDHERGKQRLLEPPVSEEALLEMANTKWGDPYFRAETIAEWSDDARVLYERLAEED